MSVEMFNMGRLQTSTKLGEYEGYIIYQSTPKSFIVQDEENDIITTVSLKARGFESQRVYINGQKVTKELATNPRKISQRLCKENIDADFQPSDRKSGTKKVNNDEKFLQFLSEKFDIDMDQMKVEFEMEQEKKKMENDEIERQIALLKAQLNK